MPLGESAGPAAVASRTGKRRASQRKANHRGFLPEAPTGALSYGAAAILSALIHNMAGEPAQMSRLRPGRLVRGARLSALRPS